jgi:hypothetical protein
MAVMRIVAALSRPPRAGRRHARFGDAQRRPRASARLRVFLDCECYTTYLREEIEWVDFVRQPQDADVQVLSATNQTGGGGEEVVLRFVGLGRFQNVDLELKAISQSGDTDDTRRQRVLRTVTVGLLSYIERAGRGDDVRIEVAPARQTGTQTAVADDPWNAWVFSIRGGGSTDLQESNREWNWEARATADRITERWILSFGASTETNREEFDLDEDEPFKVTRREHDFEWFVARALGPHWSLGLDGRVESSTFGNTRFSLQAAPAIEYTVFPYADNASRSPDRYEIGVEHASITKSMFTPVKRTDISCGCLDQQPWGELQIGAELSQYLHDTGNTGS